jgi:hypothetical protein
VHYGYRSALAVSMLALLALGAIVIAFGPERRGVVFGRKDSTATGTAP